MINRILLVWETVKKCFRSHSLMPSEICKPLDDAKWIYTSELYRITTVTSVPSALAIVLQNKTQHCNLVSNKSI